MADTAEVSIPLIACLEPRCIFITRDTFTPSKTSADQEGKRGSFSLAASFHLPWRRLFLSEAFSDAQHAFSGRARESGIQVRDFELYPY
jgi:hypothetical protein